MPSLLNPPLPAGAHRRLRWHQLYGSAAALALAEATRADRRLYVVIVDAARELERLTAELRFFAGEELALLRLPDWEVLPYELLFPHPDLHPERLKTLFDDEIEAIRRFDPETQRSLDALPGVRLLPAREVPLDTEAVKDFRRRYRTRFEGDPTRTVIYRGVSEGLAPAGVEFYQPLFFDSTATLFDYLPADAVIVHEAALPGTLGKAWADIEARYEDRRHDLERPVLRPAELFLEPSALEAALAAFASITLDAFKAETELHGAAAEVRNFPTRAPRELRLDVRAERPFAPLDAFLSEFEGRVLLAADSAGRREVLQEMLRAHRHEVAIVPGWDAFVAGTARLALTVAPDRKSVV